MAKKQVTMSLPAQTTPVGNTGAEFDVKIDDEKIGRLRVGKARVTWIPKDKKYGKKLSWEQVAKLFDEHGTDEN